MLPNNLYLSKRMPAPHAIKTPPREPAIPPSPVTEATVFFGNISDTVVKILALQAWCAAVAQPIIKTDSHIFSEPSHCAKTTGTTQIAYMSIDIFRARNTVQPLFMRKRGNHPPPILPTLHMV